MSLAFPAAATITAPELASLLGMATKTFNRHRQTLIAGGLPKPLPLPTPRKIWSRAAILNWIDAVEPTRVRVEPQAAAPADLIDLETARKKMRLGLGG